MAEGWSEDGTTRVDAAEVELAEMAQGVPDVVASPNG